INPVLPAPVIWTIERCLSKDPAERYASTRDLAREMQRLNDRVGELVAGNKPARESRRRATVVTIAALTLAVGGAAYFALYRTGAGAAGAAPTFTQLACGGGHVANARFAPDGRTILYAAGWGKAPVQVFETRPTGPESRPLGPASASLASISSQGELALILGCRLDWANCVGTLARMPQTGGAPRAILEHVLSADWTPDGAALAAVQAIGGGYTVPLPPGKSLYTTTSRLGFLRFSPKGDRLAFVEYHVVSDEEGALRLIDLDGEVRTLSTPWKSIRNLAWSPDGGEIWFSASEHGRSTSIY